MRWETLLRCFAGEGSMKLECRWLSSLSLATKFDAQPTTTKTPLCRHLAMPHRNNQVRGGPLPRDVQISKKLSWLLRHGAEKEGLTLDSDGYLNMAIVLSNQKLKSIKATFEEVKSIVEHNDKQRFDLKPDPARFAATEIDGQTTGAAPSDSPHDWIIRANQGHSIKLEDDTGLLTAITMDNMPAEAVHGTTRANWVLIAASGGLKAMGRNHVHFASGLPAGFLPLVDSASTAAIDSAPVISGMRSTSKILIYLDVAKALDAGIPLKLSKNGVILSEGNADGIVPLSLFKRVEDRVGATILLQDGQITMPAPADWSKKDLRKD